MGLARLDQNGGEHSRSVNTIRVHGTSTIPLIYSSGPPERAVDVIAFGPLRPLGTSVPLLACFSPLRLCDEIRQCELTRAKSFRNCSILLVRIRRS